MVRLHSAYLVNASAVLVVAMLAAAPRCMPTSARAGRSVALPQRNMRGARHCGERTIDATKNLETLQI